MEHFGKWLRAQVEASGRSKKQFAKEVGIEAVTLRSWFLAKKPSIRADNLVNLARVLELPKPEIEHMLQISGSTALSGNEPDQNIEPFSEEAIAVEPPFFDLPIAASGWVDVTDNENGGFHVSPSQIVQGLFRVRVRGDSMQPKYPDGCIAEFKLMKTPEGTPDCGSVIIGKRYYVQLDDGTGTFKELASCDENGLTLRAINRKYKKPLFAPFERIQRLAVLEWKLVP